MRKVISIPLTGIFQILTVGRSSSFALPRHQTSWLNRFCTIFAAVAFATTASAQYVNTLLSGIIEPVGVAVATNNCLYVTDVGQNSIIQYNISSGTTNVLVATGLSGPNGIVAARGGLVVADEYNQVIRFITYDGIVSTLAGSYQNPGLLNSSTPTSAQFSFPTGITTDSAGNIYVAELGNNDIREISTSGAVTTYPTGSYQFAGPEALAFDTSGNLWVADFGNRTNVVCMISGGVVTPIAGGGLAGAQFSHPSGLLWDGVNNRLVISDSGNSVISALTYSNGWSVQTLAGISGNSSFVNGALGTATFNYPWGLAVDIVDSGYYIADYNNKAVRVFQPSAPQPPISAPVFGYVTFPATASPADTSVFTASSADTFQNSAVISVEAEFGTQTYMTFGATGTSIPLPNSSSPTVIVYPGDGSSSVSSIIPSGSGITDFTLYAISEATGRQPSPVSSARFIFVTANPQIIGNNAADITLTDATLGAQIYYTLDGSVPTNNGTDPYVFSGTTLSLDITSNVTLNVRAFATGFAPSSMVSALLSVSNFIGNQLTFGFAGGIASSRFLASGTNFYAPVTLTLVGSPDIFAMQFDLSVSNAAGAPLTSFYPLFQSFLMNLPSGDPPVYIPINPGIVLPSGSVGTGTNYASQVMELAWITTLGQTNLYDTLHQHLTQVSVAADTLFSDSQEQVVVGGLSFAIPPNATNGTTYTIQITRPSASSFDDSVVPVPVFIQAPTNGSLTNGTINSIKVVTVESTPYLVGDVFPLYWYNAGDFGDGSLLNDDVIDTFDAAVNDVNVPPTATAYFDAMDSCNGTVNNLYSGNDSNINSIAFGDGVIDISDVYVTLQRSLNATLSNCVRYWSNGQLNAMFTNNVYNSEAVSAPLVSKQVQSGPHYITVAADQVQAGGSLTVQVPVRVLAADTLPVRVLLLNVEVDALDGSPAITNAITFKPAAGISSAAYTYQSSVSPNNYAEAWVDSTVAGISGTNVIGTFSITLPPNVNANSAYLVHFDKFSASPNGIANFVSTVQDGLITVANRTGSSWGDGIPDTWRLLYFGTVSNLLSAANADPDGDGASNWQEYIAGTNPQNAKSVFQFMPATAPSGPYFTLQWPSVVNKSYGIQYSTSIASGWVTVTNLTGTGNMMQWTDTSANGAGRFYRASVH